MSIYTKYKGCRDEDGTILPMSSMILIENFFKTPSPKNWNMIYTLVIGADSKTTLWEAVCKITPNFPKDVALDENNKPKWRFTPNVFTINKALEYAKKLAVK